MSTFKNPTGPQPPSVYWRRRAVLALGLIAVIVIIVLIVVRPGSGSGEAATASTSSAPAADGAASPSAEPAPASTETAPAADATNEPADDAAAAAAAAGATCAAGDIELKPILDKSSYASTELPQIAMSITNTGGADCVIDLGSNQQKLVVSSGEEQYWSSKDCQVNGTDQDVTLTAGQTLETPAIAWDRTRSSTDTCDSESREPVPAGGATYRLTVSVGDITSADTAPMILN